MVRHLGRHYYDRRVRVVVLLSAAATTIGRGASYLVPGWDRTAHVSFVDLLIPVEVWAAVWIAAGAAMILGVWCPRVARWSMSTAAALWATWGVSYLLAWMLLDTARAWVTAMPFGLIAVYTAVITYLMEPPEAIHPPEEEDGR